MQEKGKQQQTRVCIKEIRKAMLHAKRRELLAALDRVDKELRKLIYNPK